MVCPLRRVIDKIRRSKHRVKEVVKPKKRYRVEVHVVNCHEVPGGYIFVQGIKGGKWRKVAPFGLAKGHNCCENAVFTLEEGIYRIRANCGEYILVEVWEDRRLRLYASGCYGSTDDVVSTLKRVAIVHIHAPYSILFGVDSRVYTYAVRDVATIFLSPGEHTLFFNNGAIRRLKVRAGDEISIWLPSL